MMNRQRRDGTRCSRRNRELRTVNDVAGRIHILYRCVEMDVRHHSADLIALATQLRTEIVRSSLPNREEDLIAVE